MRQELSEGESENWSHTVAESNSYMGCRGDKMVILLSLELYTYSALDSTVSLTLSSLYHHIYVLPLVKYFELYSHSIDLSDQKLMCWS